MYSTCLFCLKDLNANRLVEHFPVGSRLAFDNDKGRLWVICRKCDRWNLSPLEERWEAIEDCEHLYETSRQRISTEQIGLARLHDGLELVRIGAPKRPEFAAWRYGDQFGRRRRAAMIKAGLGLGGLGAVVVGGTAVGVGIGSFGWMTYQIAQNIVHGSPDKVVARVDAPGETVKVRRKHLPHVQLHSGGQDGWTLGVPRGKKSLVRLEGRAALHAAGKLLPPLNRYAGKKDTVQDAVRLLQDQADPLRYFSAAARAASRNSDRVVQLPESSRLALEMAAHEEQERRALEGELAVLEDSWRDAEEVATIADNLLIPKTIDEFIQKHRRS